MAEPGTFSGELSAGWQRFRRARWGWHLLVLALVYLYVILPLTMGVPGLAFLGLLLAIGAFVLLRARAKPSTPSIALPRYCASCGETFEASLSACPACGQTPTAYPAEDDLPTLAALLDRLAADHRRGKIDAATFKRLRAVYEPTLAALRPRPEAPSAPSPAEAVRRPAPAAPAETFVAPIERRVPAPTPAPPPKPAPVAPPPRAVVPRKPPEPVTPFGELLVAWAAERQADILLYLGAFLVSVAALIFVAYQGEAVGPLARVAILTVYSLAFLVLGLLLHRWERAREAGPAFLALGAILVPIDFAAALRVEAFEDEGIPADVLWLLGSSGSATLYSLLAWRGYGRYYVVPAVPAILVAWGSLGSVLNLPIEWFGAWFQLVAAALYLAGSSGRVPLARAIRLGGFALGAGALLFASLAAVSESHHWQLAAAWALATLALLGALRFRRSVAGLSLAPLTSAATVMAATWAAAAPDPDWYAAFIAAAGHGYLLIAYLDTPDSRVWWRTVAFAPWVIAVFTAATFAGEADPARFALPLTLGVTALGPAAGFAAWRLNWRPGLAVLPTLASATAAAFFWAWQDMSPEWLGAWIATAAIGYGLAAEYDSAYRKAWQVTALAAAAGAVAGSHLAFVSVEDPRAHPFALPIMYAVVTAGVAAGIARWRFDWRAGLTVLPPLMAATAASFWWAWLDASVAWMPAWIAAAAVGYLLVAEIDARERPAWQGAAHIAGAIAIVGAVSVATGVDGGSRLEFVLPLTLGILAASTAACVARWRLQWRTGLSVLPALVSGAIGTLAWAWLEMPYQWTGAWIATAAAGYLLPAEFDRALRPAWQTVAMATGALAVAAAAPAAFSVERDPNHEFVLTTSLGILAASAGAGVARWRLAWRPGITVVAPLTVSAVGTLAWAWLEMPYQWTGAWIAAAAVGYLLPAEFDRALRPAWQSVAMGAGALAIAGAAVAALSVERDPNHEFVLTTSLAVLAAGAAAGVARWRLDWRPGISVVSPLAVGAVGTLAWAWLEMPYQWSGAWIAAVAVGYLLPAEFDPRYRPAWQVVALATGGLALAAAVPAAFAIDRDPNHEFVLTTSLAVLAAGAAAGVARWHLAWRPGIATLPALVAAGGAALLWAWIDMPSTWTGAWLAGAAAGYLLPGEFDNRYRPSWRMAAFYLGGTAIFAAHLGAGGDLPHPAQLPITYGIALVANLADAARRRDWSLLGPPGLAAGFGATTLWAAGAGPEWWGFPAIGLAAAGVATERLWRRSDSAAAWGWFYVLVLAAAPTIASLGTYQEAYGNGLVVCAVAAAVFGAAAWRCRGVLGARFARSMDILARPESVLLAEQATLAYTGAAFLLGAGAYFNASLELATVDRSWVFLALSAIAWLAGAATGRRGYTGPIVAVPPAVFAVSLSAGLAAESPAVATTVLITGAVMPALAFATTRFPPFWLASAIYASLAVWSGWEWAGFAEWTLPGAYAASGAITWLALFGLRRYARLEAMRDTTIHVLSWAPWLVAGIIALGMLSERSGRIAGDELLAETPEWGMFVAVLATASAAVTIEGWRLHRRLAQQVGTLGLLLALLMTIAIGDPANVQAYAAPIGLYLVGTGLTIRSSQPFFGRHMDVHETLIVAGALFIVLPPAEQGFEPGGEAYGFELIGIGLGFLFVGLVLHARWLVPAGVLTITGVAVRWLTGGFVQVPFWLILGILGTLLLAAGTFILLQRERWDAWRTGARQWWLQTTAGPPPAAPGHPAGR